MIETTKQPYELLVRWGEDGALKGAHIGFALVATEDGNRLSWMPLPVMPVGDKGFPLADLLPALHIDALKRCADLEGELQKHEKTIEARELEISGLREHVESLTKTLNSKSSVLHKVADWAAS